MARCAGIVLTKAMIRRGAMLNSDSETGCLITGLIIGALVALICLGILVKNHTIPTTYKRAQMDAMNGNWKYQIIDGEVWEIQGNDKED